MLWALIWGAWSRKKDEEVYRTKLQIAKLEAELEDD